MKHFRRIIPLIAILLASAASAQQMQHFQIKSTTGTAFYINRAGHLITSEHVVRGCQNIVLYTAAGMAPATLVATDPESDLAVLKTNQAVPAIVPLRWNIASLQLGEKVAIYGFPGGKASYTPSTVVGLTGVAGEPGHIQLRSVVQRGNSGGPVLDTNGNVIAVVKAYTELYSEPERAGDKPRLISVTDIAVTLESLKKFLTRSRIPFYESTSSTTGYADGILEHNAKKFIIPVRCILSYTPVTR